MHRDTLKLFWWNTGLSSLVKINKTKDVEKFEIVLNYLMRILEQDLPDVIALCEITNDELEKIHRHLQNNHPSSSNLQMHVLSQTQNHDIGLIYNSDKLELINSKLLNLRVHRKLLRLGEQINFLCRLNTSVFSLFLSHLQSRLTYTAKSFLRIQLGQNLYNAIRDQLNSKSHCICMGDFNDEPFSDSMTEGLRAIRDRDLVKNDISYLYNPFWRLLGESHPYPDDHSNVRICGTHYYLREKKWVTFDQILFSPAYLADKKFELIESECRIKNEQFIRAAINQSKNKFDHFPISAVVKIKD